jgi:hypothetical protein
MAGSRDRSDKDMAREFLAVLDPNATRFTFQFFGDGAGTYAEIFHGALDEVWPKVRALNTPERRVGVFVNINETDFKGRRRKNIVRTRALFVDADSDKQVVRCVKTFDPCGATPSMAVKSGRGVHFYFCTDVPLDQFSEWQKSLINKVGTDPAVKDLPRVMRLPGTLHLKDPTKPRLVKLYPVKHPVRRLQFSELVERLGLSPTASALKPYAGATPAKQSNVILFDPALFPKRPIPPEGIESLADGLGYDNRPLDLAPLVADTGCGFIREAMATGGKDYAQPLWNLTTLVATFLEDGQALAHKMGEQHPEYTAESTDALWERKLCERKGGLGWPGCNAIQSNGCTDCATCPHLSKGKSPLNLTHPVAVVALADPHHSPQVTIAGAVFRDLDRSNKPRPTLANAVIAIKALGIEASYDLFHHRAKVTYNGKSKTIHEGLLTDHTVSAARSLINNTDRIDCGDDNTLAAINEIAWANAYDPVLDMLDDCQGKWDGRKRLDTWAIDYLGCEDTPLNRAIGRKTLIAACRRARVAGCKHDEITVLEGPEGIDKSTAIRVLAGDENFNDQSILGASDKEVQEQLEGTWMHESADLAGMRRAEVESVKAFARRQVDRARRAYGRVREDIPRRSIEWGTTNNKEYLLSQTGNRCFWPLECGKIKIEALRRDREQLLGEAATYETAGESIGLDKSLWGVAREAQEQRRVADPWEDILDHMPDTVTVDDSHYQNHTVTIIHKSGDGYERVASADVLLHVLRIPAAQQNSSHGQRLAHAMPHVGWKRNKSGLVTINERSARGYIRSDGSLPVDSSLEDPVNAQQPGDIGAQAAMALDGEETSLPDKGRLAGVSPVQVPPAIPKRR